MNIQKVLTRIHKCIPTDKMCTYCFMCGTMLVTVLYCGLGSVTINCVPVM